METIERVAEMMITLEEFSDLLQHETAAIRSANLPVIEKMAERKQYLALHYQRQLRMLSDRRQDLGKLAPEVKKRLAASWTAFDKQVAEKVAVLEVAQHATRNVVDIIVRAIRDAQGLTRENAAYQGSGKSKQGSGGVVSISLNQVL